MKIEIYTKTDCPNCQQAKQIFDSKGWAYTEHHITEANHGILLEELAKRMNMIPRSVPQIFIDNQAIGGYTQLQEWLRNK